MHTYRLEDKDSSISIRRTSDSIQIITRDVKSDGNIEWGMVSIPLNMIATVTSGMLDYVPETIPYA